MECAMVDMVTEIVGCNGSVRVVGGVLCVAWNLEALGMHYGEKFESARVERQQQISEVVGDGIEVLFTAECV